jgi:peptidyl-tRNA hydrolase, PTH2 family
MSNIKQVIILRRDLNMRLGKSCSQVAHASMKIFFDRMNIISEKNIEINQRMYCCRYEYDCKNEKHFNCAECISFELAGRNTQSDFTDEMIEWMKGSFAKIVVGCNSEQELFDLQKQADEEGIVNALILDNGNTEFKKVCPFCQGSGEVVVIQELYSDISEDCAECDGTGKINKPTYTCLAIGPDLSDKIDKITGGLKLL